MLDRPVAIKLLDKEAMGAASFDRLRDEARALARFSHPNVVTVHEYYEGDGEAALVMEYVEGETLAARLAARLAERGVLDLQEVFVIASAAGDALASAHEAGLTHGDIKPANIMLPAKGAPKMIDFGLARRDRAEDIAATVDGASSMTTGLRGTLPYMPPELLLGEPADARSDIFSLGAVLYEMLTGRRAFRADTEASLLHEILHHEPSAPSLARTDLAGGWDALLSSMLEKDRSRRLASMAAFQKALEDLRADRRVVLPKSARQSSLGFGPRFAPGKSKMVGRAAALALFAFAAAGGWVFLERSDRPAAQQVVQTVAERVAAGLDELARFQSGGDLQRAISLFEGVLYDDPDHAAATAGLALTLMRQYTSAKSDEALLSRARSLSIRALELDPFLALAHMARGEALEREGAIEAAVEHLEEARRLDPTHPHPLVRMSFILSKTDRKDEAVALLKQAIEEGVDRGRLGMRVGVLLYSMNELDEAGHWFREVRQIDPENIYAYLNLASVLFRQGDLEAGIREIQKGLSVRPHHLLYANLGTFLFYAGHYARAAHAYERALDHDGNAQDHQLWANLGDAYRQIPQRGEDARLAFRRAAQFLGERLQRNKATPKQNARLGYYLFRAGDREAGLMAMRQADAEAEDDPQIDLWLAYSHTALDRFDRATAHVASALEAGYPVKYILQDPELSALREQLQFQKFLAENE